MKTIKGVDLRPESFDDEVTAEVAEKIPTYRRLFKSALGLGAAKDGENAIDLLQIGLKLKVDGVDVALEDAEFKTLKERCSQNPAGWQAHYHGQVMLKLKEAEDAKNG